MSTTTRHTSKPHSTLDPIRSFNKKVTNQITMRFAGHILYSVVEHKGRVSGKTYHTPVVAAAGVRNMVIPLPYGTDTDWCLNILTAGGCRIQNRGTWYTVTNPEVIDAHKALPAFSQWFRVMFRLFNIEKFLWVKIQPEAPAPA